MQWSYGLAAAAGLKFDKKLYFTCRDYVTSQTMKKGNVRMREIKGKRIIVPLGYNNTIIQRRYTAFIYLK